MDFEVRFQALKRNFSRQKITVEIMDQQTEILMNLWQVKSKTLKRVAELRE